MAARAPPVWTSNRTVTWVPTETPDAMIVVGVILKVLVLTTIEEAVLLCTTPSNENPSTLELVPRISSARSKVKHHRSDCEYEEPEIEQPDSPEYV